MILKPNNNNMVISWIIGIIVLSSVLGIINPHVIGQLNNQNSSLTNHAPIQINSSLDFTPVNGVTEGNGSPENPWIIENLSITTSISIHGVGKFCVFIQDTSEYFIIRNCTISNYSAIAGIYLFNVSNGIIENNVIENNYDSGIAILYSNNITIIRDIIKNHRESGMYMFSTSEMNIRNNTFESNQDADIISNGNTNVTLTGNDFEIGISIDGDDPYIPDEPPTPSNEIYIWIAIIIIIVAIIFSIMFLWHKKFKLKKEEMKLEKKDDKEI